MGGGLAQCIFSLLVTASSRYNFFLPAHFRLTSSKGGAFGKKGIERLKGDERVSEPCEGENSLLQDNDKEEEEEDGDKKKEEEEKEVKEEERAVESSRRMLVLCGVAAGIGALMPSPLLAVLAVLELSPPSRCTLRSTNAHSVPPSTQRPYYSVPPPL